MFENALDLFTSPTTLLIIAAALGIMKGLGELLIKLGNTGKWAAQDNDPLDSVGAFLMNLVDGLGKILAFFAPGNRPKHQK